MWGMSEIMQRGVEQEQEREARSDLGLEKVRRSLFAYALSDPPPFEAVGLPGRYNVYASTISLSVPFRYFTLPCPDVSGVEPGGDENLDGSSDADITSCRGKGIKPLVSGSRFGRLPWRTLEETRAGNDYRYVRGVDDSDPRDGYGQRFWYGVSDNVIADPKIPFNPHYLVRLNTGWLTARRADGSVLSDRVAAVVIAPGVYGGDDTGGRINERELFRGEGVPLEKVDNPDFHKSYLQTVTYAEFQGDKETFTVSNDTNETFSDIIDYLTIDDLVSDPDTGIDISEGNRSGIYDRLEGRGDFIGVSELLERYLNDYGHLPSPAVFDTRNVTTRFRSLGFPFDSAAVTIRPGVLGEDLALERGPRAAVISSAVSRRMVYSIKDLPPVYLIKGTTVRVPSIEGESNIIIPPYNVELAGFKTELNEKTVALTMQHEPGVLFGRQVAGGRYVHGVTIDFDGSVDGEVNLDLDSLRVLPESLGGLVPVILSEPMPVHFIDDELVNIIRYPHNSEDHVRELPPYAVQAYLPAGTPVTINATHFNFRFPANFLVEGRYVARTEFVIEKSSGHPVDLLTTLDAVATIAGVPNGWPAVPGHFGFLPIEDALTVRRSNYPVSLQILNRPAVSEIDAGLRVYASAALTVVPFPPPGAPPPGTPVVGTVVTPIPLPSPFIVTASTEFAIPKGSRILYPTDSHFPVGDDFVFPDESIVYFPKRTVLPAVLHPDSVLPSGERLGGDPMTATVVLHHGGMAHLRGVWPVRTGADILSPDQQAFDIDMRGGGRFYGEGKNYTVSLVSRERAGELPPRLVTVIEPIVTAKIAVVRMGVKRFRFSGGYLHETYRGVGGFPDTSWQWFLRTHGLGAPSRIIPTWATKVGETYNVDETSRGYAAKEIITQYDEPALPGYWLVTIQYPVSGKRYLEASDFTGKVAYSNAVINGDGFYYYPDPDQFEYTVADRVSGYRTVVVTVRRYEPYDEIAVQGAYVSLNADQFELRERGGCFQGVNPGTVGFVRVTVSAPPLCDKDEPGLCWYFYRENYINNRLTAPLPGGAKCYAYSPTSIDPINERFFPGMTTRWRVKTTLVATDSGTISINIEPDSLFHPFTGSQVIPSRPYRIPAGEVLYSPHKVRGKFLTHTNIEAFPELKAAWAVPHDSSSLRITLARPGGFYPGGNDPQSIGDPVVLSTSYDEDTEFVLPAEFILTVEREVVYSPWEQLTLRRELVLPENTSIFDPEWGDLATIVLPPPNGERPRGVAIGQRLRMTLVHTVIAIEGGTLVTELSVRLTGGRARFQIQNNNWWNFFDIQLEPIETLPYLEFGRRDITGPWYEFLTGQYYTQGLNCSKLGYIPPCTASPQNPATLTPGNAVFNIPPDVLGRPGKGHFIWPHLQTPGWYHNIWVLEPPTRTTLFPGIYGGKTVAYDLSERHFVLTPDTDMFLYNPKSKVTRIIDRGSVVDLLDGIVYPPGAKHRLPRVASDKRLVSSGESHIYIDRPVTLRTDFPISEVQDVDETVYGSIVLRQRASKVRMSVHYVQYDGGTPSIGIVTLAADLRGGAIGKVIGSRPATIVVTTYVNKGFPEVWWDAHAMVYRNIVRFRNVPVYSTSTISVPVVDEEGIPSNADRSEAPRQGRIVLPENSYIIIPPAHQMEFFSRPRVGYGVQLKGSELAELPQGAVAVIPPGATLKADRLLSVIVEGYLPDGSRSAVYVVDTFTLVGPAHMALGSTVSTSDEGGVAHFVNHDDYFTGDPLVFLNEPGNLVQLRNAEGRNVHVPIQQNTRFDIFGRSERWTERGIYRNASPLDVGEFYGDFPLLYAVAPECRGELSEGRECAEDKGEGLVFKVEDGEEYYIDEPLVAPEPVLMVADVNGGELEIDIRDAAGTVKQTGLRIERLFVSKDGMVEIEGGSGAPVLHDMVVVRPKKTGSQGRRVKLRAYVGATDIDAGDLATLSYAETEGSFTVHVGGYLGDDLDGAKAKAVLVTGQQLSLGVGALLRGDIGINERRYGVFGAGGKAELRLQSGGIMRVPLDDYRLVEPKAYHLTVTLSADAGDIDSTGSPYHQLAAGQVFRVSARAPNSFGLSVIDFGTPLNAVHVTSDTVIPMEPGYLWQGYIPSGRNLSFTPNALRDSYPLPGGEANPLGTVWPPGEVYLRVQPDMDRLNLWGSGGERLEGLDGHFGVGGELTVLATDGVTVQVTTRAGVGNRVEARRIHPRLTGLGLPFTLNNVSGLDIIALNNNFDNHVIRQHNADFGGGLTAPPPASPSAGFLARAMHPTISLVVRVRNLVDGTSELATVHWNPVAVEGGATVRAMRWNHARNDVFAGPVTVNDNATLTFAENTRNVPVPFTTTLAGTTLSAGVQVPTTVTLTLTGGITLREIADTTFGDQAMWVAPRNTITAGINAITVSISRFNPNDRMTLTGNLVSAISDYTHHGELSYIDNFMCNGVPSQAYYNMAPFPVAASPKAPLKTGWEYPDFGRQAHYPRGEGNPLLGAFPGSLKLSVRSRYAVSRSYPSRADLSVSSPMQTHRRVPAGGLSVRAESDLYFYLDRAIQGPGNDFQSAILFGGDFVLPGPAAIVPPFAGRSERALSDVYAGRSKFFADAVGSPALKAVYGAATGDCVSTNDCAAMYSRSEWFPILNGALATDPAVNVSITATFGRAIDSVRLVMPQPEAVVQLADGTDRAIYAGSILYPRNNLVVPSHRLEKGNYELQLYGPAYAAVDVSPAIGIRPRFFRQNQEGEFTADKFNPTPLAVPATCVVEPLHFVTSQQTLFSTADGILRGGANVAATVTVAGGRDFIAHTGYDTTFSRGFLANNQGSEFQAGRLSGKEVENYRKAGEAATEVQLQTVVSPTATVAITAATITTIQENHLVTPPVTTTVFTYSVDIITLWGDRVRSIVDPFASNEYVPENRHDLYPLNYDFRVPPPQSYPWLHGEQPGVEPLVLPTAFVEYRLRVHLDKVTADVLDPSVLSYELESFLPDALAHPGFRRVRFMDAITGINPRGAIAEVDIVLPETDPPPTTLNPFIFEKKVRVFGGQRYDTYYDLRFGASFAIIASTSVPSADNALKLHDIPLGVDRVSLGTSQETQEAAGLQLRSEGNEFTALRLAHQIRIPKGAVTRFDVQEPRGAIPYPTEREDFFQFPGGSEAMVVKADAGSWLSAHPYIARNPGTTVRLSDGRNFVVGRKNDGLARFDVGGMRVMHYLRAQTHEAFPPYSGAPIYTNVWLRLSAGGFLRNTETGNVVRLPAGAILNPVLGTWVYEDRGVVEEGGESTEGKNLRNNYLAPAVVAAGVNLEVVRAAVVFPKKTRFVIKGEASITNVKAAVIFSLSPLPLVSCPTGDFDLMTGQGGIDGVVRRDQVVGIDQISEGVSENRYKDTTGTGAVGAGHPCAWGDDPENLDGDRTYVYRSRRRYVNPDVQARTLSNDRTYLLGGRLVL